MTTAKLSFILNAQQHILSLTSSFTSYYTLEMCGLSASLHKSCKELGRFEKLLSTSHPLCTSQAELCSRSKITSAWREKTSKFRRLLTSAEWEKFSCGQHFSANKLVDCPHVSQGSPVSQLYPTCWLVVHSALSAHGGNDYAKGPLQYLELLKF